MFDLGGRGEEFVAVDFGSHAELIGLRLDAHDLRVTKNVDVASHGDFFRQRKDELQGAAGLVLVVDGEIQAAETNVASPALALGVSAGSGRTHR